MLLPSANVMNNIFGESLFDDFFDDFARPMRTASRFHNANGIMRTDIKESDAGYVLDIDLPGCKKENVKAELKNGYLRWPPYISAASGITELAAEASMWARKSSRRILRQDLRTAF